MTKRELKTKNNKKMAKKTRNEQQNIGIFKKKT
jgi:hypothetical protein